VEPSHARLALCILALFSGCASPPRASVIWIVVDTLRADHLAQYGYPRSTLPSLDRLAGERGVLFEAAYTPQPETTPAFASLLTGLSPSRHGVHALYQKLHGDNLSLAEILAGEGFQTAAFVSSFVMIRDFSGLDQGFQVYDDFVAERERNRENFERRAGSTLPIVSAWLRGRDPDVPFFLLVHLIDPHAPYTPPEPWDREFRTAAPRPLPFPVPAAARIPDAETLDDYVDAYDGEIAYLDHQLSMFLVDLQRLDLFDRSLVVFTADHGESLGEAGHYFRHGDNLGDENVLVPLMIKPAEQGTQSWPVRRVAAAVSLVDLAPTTLDLLGVAPPAALDGRSLRQLLEGKEERSEAPVELWSKPLGESRQYGRVWNDRKLVLDDKTGKIELHPRGIGRTGAPAAASTSAESERLRAAAVRAFAARTPFAVETNFMELALRGDFVRRHLSERDAADLERLRSLGYIN
jgi:arylsulfatase A-like enzyme